MNDAESRRVMIAAIDGPKRVNTPPRAQITPVPPDSSTETQHVEQCLQLADALHRATRALVCETRSEPPTARCFAEMTLAASATGWFYEARKHGTGQAAYFRERARACADVGARQWRRLGLGSDTARQGRER